MPEAAKTAKDPKKDEEKSEEEATKKKKTTRQDDNTRVTGHTSIFSAKCLPMVVHWNLQMVYTEIFEISHHVSIQKHHDQKPIATWSHNSRINVANFLPGFPVALQHGDVFGVKVQATRLCRSSHRAALHRRPLQSSCPWHEEASCGYAVGRGENRVV